MHIHQVASSCLSAGLILVLGVTGCRPATPVVPRRSGGAVARDPGWKQAAVTAHPAATAAALAVLRRGGNAADAAVAAAFALAVVEPHSSGVGGGGVAVVRRSATGEVTTLDFRERAPGRATADMYLKAGLPYRNPSQVGHLAVAIPSMVAGMEALHRQAGSGRLTWAALLEPARKLAAQGFPVSAQLHEAIRGNRRKLARFPEARRIFLREGPAGSKEPAALPVGATLRQPDLARTLGRLQRHGAKDFYRGEIAALLVAEMRQGGGILEAADLAGYRARWAPPVRGRYRGYELYGMGPPSSGGIHVVQILQILEGFPLGSYAPEDPRGLHLVAEAMRLAFADRAAHQGDAAFAPVPVRGLLSRRYAASLRARIDPRRAQPPGSVRAGTPDAFQGPEDGKHTTHLGVLDAAGNAVSMTLTINTRFGSGVVARATGVLLNNEMDDFAARPGKPNAFGLIQSARNAPGPGRAPLSSMSPTLVFRGGRICGLVGAAGGPTIITSVVQILLHLIDHHQGPADAVRQPRIHHQWRPQRLYVERPTPSNRAVMRLLALGHTVAVRRPWGRATLLWIDARGRLWGAADPRGEGVAGGF